MFESWTNGWIFAGGAALFTLVAGCWSHLKNVYRQLASRLVMTITVSGYESEAVMLYLKSHFRVSRWGPRSYLGWMLFVRGERRVRLVPMEVAPPAGRLYWRGWKPLWTFRATRDREDMEAGENARNYESEQLSLAYLRGTFDADELIFAAAEWFNRQVVDNFETGGRRHVIKHIFGSVGQERHTEHSRPTTLPTSTTDIRGCLQYRPVGWSFADLGPEQSEAGSASDSLVLTAEAELLVEEARRWKESEEWHKLRGIPWRRGWLLHGPPGTGKTALTRAVAEDLDLPVFVFDLASLKNRELQAEWSKMLAEVPCMALIEDVDAVFNGRENIAQRDRQYLTFDCLLNCLDGIERVDGLFVVITTNRPEQIDPALGGRSAGVGSTRPGRIDRVLELRPLDEAGRRKMASRILPDFPGEWERLARDGAGDSGAQFQERCARHAIGLHYQESKSSQSNRLSAGPRHRLTSAGAGLHDTSTASGG